MEEDEDDFISYGTPLPEIEEETVLRKKAVRELEVRDEKGRQRFHGAFTGGFSAGYFNTVGTKEGWAPSTFVSSRDKKSSDLKQQNPEDFMDDEDFGAFGIATKRIHTTSNFQDASDAKGNKRKFTEIDSVIPGEAPLKDIVKPVKESIGIKILRKLGWKPGQGIGPRIKKIANVKLYGCSPFPEASELEEDDPYAQSFTFAPDDTESEIYQPKDNVFGLGYSGLSKQSVLNARIDTFTPTTTKSWLKKDKKKLAISGQAFGVGAFEDDDEDIYSKDDMSQYDFSDLELRGASQESNASGSKQLSIAHNVVEGFCLASQPPAIKKYYPPPELPSNFKPVRIFITPKIHLHQEAQFKPRHNLSADERSFVLGEKKFQLTSEKKSLEIKPVVENINRSLLKSTHSFRPFPNDEAKQKRYEEYLILKDLGELHKLIQPPSMTEWEKQQEVEEFARAAMLFKPLSSTLSAKFESRSHLDVEHEVMDALAKARKESSKKTEEKRKLVGMHNRKTSEWHPASLLCKRFNVPNPYPNSSEVSGLQKSKSLFDHISFDSREIEQNSQQSDSSSKIVVVEETLPVDNKNYADRLPTNSSSVSSNKNENIQDQPFEIGRPPIDFFKDIFENSSSDEEDSPSAETENLKTPTETKIVEEEKKISFSENSFCPTEDVSGNKTTENKKVGFGVFANLDLDALNQRTPKLNIEQRECSESKCEIMDISENFPKENGVNNDKANSTLSNDLYGPELPPNYSESSYSASPKFERKKSKHKVKHKHHKHKNKKKKKKHSSHKNSEDSSFDSDEDIPPTVILEKFKKLQKILK